MSLELTFSPHEKKRFLKNYLSITWHSLISPFFYYPTWMKMWPFISTYLKQNPLYPRILYVKFYCNWPSGSWEEEDFIKLSMYFSMCLLSPLEKNAWPLNWTNLHSRYARILCVMLSWVWPRGSGDDFQKMSIYFTLLLLSPLRKRARSFIWKKLNSLNQRMFSAKFGEIGPVFLEQSSMYFNYVAIISLWQRAWFFIWTNLNHLHLGIL